MDSSTLSSAKRVLIVEDDANLSASLASLLVDQGYIVTKATRAHDAILKLMNQRFDCVLLDLKLLGGDGEELIGHVRNDRVNRHAAIFVMSGYLSRDVINRIRSRVNGILVKPFEPRSLVERIEAARNSSIRAA